MVVFTLLAVVGAAASVFLKERCNQLFVSCGVLFSVGVLVAGGLVHLLPDSNEEFKDLGVEFQWGSTIAGGTVVVLSCIEMTMERHIETRAARDGDAAGNKNEVADDTIDETCQRDSLSVGLLQNTEDNFVVDDSRPFSAALLSIALSIHSILEGWWMHEALSIGM